MNLIEHGARRGHLFTSRDLCRRSASTSSMCAAGLYGVPRRNSPLKSIYERGRNAGQCDSDVTQPSALLHCGRRLGRGEGTACTLFRYSLSWRPAAAFPEPPGLAVNPRRSLRIAGICPTRSPARNEIETASREHIIITTMRGRASATCAPLPPPGQLFI